MENYPQNNSNAVMAIDGQDFIEQSVILDFHEFNNCTFKKCTLIFHGYGPVGLVGCEFSDCKWTFSGPASATLNFMAHLYKNGKGADKIIEDTFDNILRGQYL